MKKILLLAGLTLSVVSCTKDFEDINKSTYGITDKELERIPNGGAQIQDANIWIMPDQENGWQMGMDLVGIYSGYCAANNFIDDFNAYTPRASWNEYPYSDTYKHLYPNYNPIKAKTKGDMSKPEFALATIVRCAITQRLTDMYGPLPYSKVNGIDLQVPYDSQKDIYFSILEELKAASEALDKLPANYRRYKDYDVIFSGDMHAWAKYARSIMLRMAVRMAKQEPAKAKEYAEYAVAQGVITTNAENALKASNDNPLFKVSQAWGDSRVSADIVSYMTTFKDPRSDKYFTPVAARGGKPFGFRSGSPMKAKAASDIVKYSAPNLTKTSPIVLFSAAEGAFLRAEGVMNGWNVGLGKDVKALYEEGIRLSFEQWGVDLAGLDTYLANADKVGAFVDPLNPALNDANFKSDITVAWDNANGDKAKELSKIITQKWIAMFPYNTIEAWTEWRRTGYPNLMPSLNNKSAGAVQDITQVDGKDVGGMRRLKFGKKDWEQNSSNVEKAVAYLGGADEYATNLWWAK